MPSIYEIGVHLESSKELSLPVTVHIVIEGEFLVFPYVPVCEDAHADVLSHCPFRNVAVGVTAMICKSADTTSLCSIDVLENRRKTISSGGTSKCNHVLHLSVTS